MFFKALLNTEMRDFATLFLYFSSWKRHHIEFLQLEKATPLRWLAPVSITFQQLHSDGSVLRLFISWNNNNDTKKQTLILVKKWWSFSPHNGLPLQQYDLLKTSPTLYISKIVPHVNTKSRGYYLYSFSGIQWIECDLHVMSKNNKFPLPLLFVQGDCTWLLLLLNSGI